VPNAKKRARHIAEPLHLVELWSIERQLESLLKKRELIDKFNSVPPFVPPV
jgi:hypothetical protein